jgi:4-hydroxy-4-methyl-2-oxoglutarate aldolase
MSTTTMTDRFERLAQLGAATVHEAQGRIGAMDSGIKPLDPSMKLAGPAVTVDCLPSDNLAIHQAVTVARPGDVLVVDAKAFIEAGPWGDVLSLYAQLAGIAGLVIDGSVRDTRQIVQMGFPVFSRAICIKGTLKFQPGAVNAPIVCAGVRINPGDIVVGDADGVVIVPALDLDRVQELAEAREAKEELFRAELRAGKTLVDLLELGPRLHELGYR